MKQLRSLLLVVAAVIALGACTSIDCSINNVVECQWQLRTPTGLDTLKTDTLTIYSLRADGADTTLYNRGTGSVTAFALPMSHVREADVLFLNLKDTTGQSWTDTITIQKANQVHMESVDCSPQYYHTLTGVSHTTHIIDSLVINHSNVTNDATLKHLYLYLRDH